MRVFRPGRFPHRVTRIRQLEGDFNSRGEWTPGAEFEDELRASVQPIVVEDRDLVEGAGLSDRIKVYTPEPDALLAAFDDREADKIRWDGEVYTVIAARTWTGKHTRAVCLRET